MAPFNWRRGQEFIANPASAHPQVMRRQATSNFDTVGIAYADIVGYHVARIDTISNDSELFDNIPPEMFQENGKIKKLRSSMRIINKIKNLSLYEVKADKK